MADGITRRTFLSSAVMTGASSALGLDRAAHRGSANEDALPPRKSSFDESWMFCKGDPAGAQLPDYLSDAWTTVDLPHDWSIAGPFSKDEPCGGSGGYLPTGIAWYRKSFQLPRTLAHRRVSVQFDGVYQRSEVWINGHSLGMRPYGYITFSHDLTPYLRFGNESNVIAVRVDNSLQPNSRWYSGSGIYRHVWLELTDPVHVAPWGTTIRSTEIMPERATVEILTQVRNGNGYDAKCVLTTEVVDGAGRIVKTDSVEESIAAGDEHLFKQTFAITQPDLWSVATPHLYLARQRLTIQEAEVDAVTTSFGIRDIQFDKDKGFLLNGTRIKLNGVCLHHDGGAVGAAVPGRVWERRLNLLKEMGCNAIRCSHNPPAPEFLDLCDGMGFLVMAEAFDEWREGKEHTPQFGYHNYFDEWGERDIADMVARDRNHPSIVIWSAGNEVPDQVVPRGQETLRRLLDLFHTEDPTRMVTVACDRIAADPVSATQEFLAELDVVGYNYVDRWRDRTEKYYSIDRHDYPQRRFIGTESVTMHGARGVYAVNTQNTDLVPNAMNECIQVEQLQKFIQTYDYVSGDFMWTGIDYLGEAHWPSKSASSGVIDTCGFRKDAYYFYQSLWTNSPVLHLFPHWNWKGNEGDVIEVSCFTNCDTVELFLNGKSLGVKGFSFPRDGMVGKYGNYPPRAKILQTTADLHLTWDVAYAPGTLRAVGTKNGQVMTTVEIDTTGDPAAIKLMADCNVIKTAWRDVVHITVEVVDEKGRVVPTAENEIAFELDGPGRILGVDNGRPDSHESFQGNHRKAFNGLALVILQSTGKSGTFSLSASSPGLAANGIIVTSHAG
jgi:beta-galactosidase